MRILMISAAPPRPATNGASRRIAAIADYLATRHDVTVLANHCDAGCNVMGERADHAYHECYLPMPRRSKFGTFARACISPHSFVQLRYRNEPLCRKVTQMLQRSEFDCVWVNMLCMAPCLNSFLSDPESRSHRSVLLVLDQHNVDDLYYRSFLKCDLAISRKAFALLEMAKAYRIQRKWYPIFDLVLCVSEEDLSRTCDFIKPLDHAMLAPNGVDVDYFKPQFGAPAGSSDPLIVFGASMDATMNQDGIHWFHQRVWPRIRAHTAGARLWVVGRNPPQEIVRLSRYPGVQVTGTVPDVRSYYSAATVFIVPLRTGGGTKIKTLEAMAMGLPVVSTSVGAQGLNATAGEHLLIADDPDEFATRVTRLIDDPEMRGTLGEAARRFAVQHYSWTNIFSRVDARLLAFHRQLLHQPTPLPLPVRTA